ncbi:MAG: MFS transporter [Firmicutes bacterium]|nr:MFS transporter [Bacillota bacterium]
MENAARRTHIYAFCAATTLFWFAMYTYVPILAPYVEHLGGSLSMAGLVVGSYGFTQMLVRIPIGFASDRLGRRKPFVILGLCLAAASSLGLGIATGPTAALIFRGTAGLAAGTWVAFSVLFASYLPPDQTARSMGLLMFFTTMGQTLATTIGGVLVDLLGWKAPFFVGAAAGFLSLLLTGAVAESPAASARSIDLADLARVGSDRQLLKVSGLGIVFQALTYASVHGFTPSYAVQLGASGTDLSILALISALPAAVISLWIGALTDRLGERTILVGSIVLFAGAVLVIPLSTRLGTLYLSQALGSVGRGTIMPVLMSLAIKEVAAEYRATAMGFYQSIYALGMTLGPVVMGLVGDAVGLRFGFVLIGLLGFAAAGLARQWIPGESRTVTRSGRHTFQD